MPVLPSRHATKRCQQLGIRQSAIEAIVRFGDREVDVGGGCTALSISRGACMWLRQERTALAADTLRNLIVVMKGDRLITAMHGDGRRATRYLRDTR